MNQQTIPTSLAPELLIDEIHGDLQIKGWDKAEVNVKANPDNLTLEEQDDSLQLSCQGSCAIRLPQGAMVKIERVHGNARIKYVEDQINIEEVNGSLSLRNAGETQIGTVQGELSARNLDGSLQVEHVNGNLSVRNIQGNCLIDEVNGNLDLRDIDGSIKTSANGNARIRLSVLSGDSYEISAGGNVNCRIPSTANLKLKLSSGARIIKVRLPEETKNFQQEACELTLGTGDTTMEISTRGMLFLSAEDVDWRANEEMDEDMDSGAFSDNFSEQITQQVEEQLKAQMDAINRQLNEQMANLSASISKAGLSEEQTEEIIKRARESNERATARAQEKIRRAQEKLERKIEAARRRSELQAQAAERRSQSRGKSSWNFEWSAPESQPAKENVSDEERLMILRMLEQKKISLEEAEELLAALEGKEG
jgi:DUF4097 and DUF4098 domain-containing protein YvlB